MPKYVESEMLELKEKYTDVICKEIVSFLNTSGGTIVIGVKDFCFHLLSDLEDFSRFFDPSGTTAGRSPS